MMMRKRTRSIQKDQEMSHLMRDAISRSCLESDVLGQKQKTGSFINAPGLFVGFTPKALEPDSVRSPTSPLDFKLFPNITNPFRSPRSPKEGHQMKWDNSKVGLSIVDSLVDDEDDDDDADNAGKPGRVIGSSASKSILFGPKMRIDSLKLQSRSDSFDQAPKSLPKNYGYFPRAQVKPSNLQKGCSNDVFGIRKTTFEQEALGNSSLSCSLDSGSHLTCLTNRTSYPASGNFGSAKRTNPANSPSRLSEESHNFFGALTASEIELSEDYTCVKTYGPNPKTTHIFGGCILECHQNNLTDLSNNGRQKIQPPQAKPVQCLKTSALHEAFVSQYPSVKGAKVVIDPSTGRSKGYGFVRFGDENERSRAMTEMNGVYCLSRQMRISAATPKKQSGNQQQYSSQVLSGGYAPNGVMPQAVQPDGDLSNTTIFVGGINAEVTEDDLRQSFSQCGDIVSVKIPAGKGCGFVQFAYRSSAEDAIQRLNGIVIGSQTVRLSWGRTPVNKQWRTNTNGQHNGAYYGNQGGYGYGAPQYHQQDQGGYAAAGAGYGEQPQPIS